MLLRHGRHWNDNKHIMRNNASKKIWLSLGAFLFNTSAVSFFGSFALNLPLLGVILITLTANKQTALLWALITGIIMEIFSPFPMLAYFAAILIVFVILRIFINSYMSNCTLFGVMASSSLGVLCFEIILKMIAHFSAFINPGGWIPVINQTYFWFLASRLSYNTLLVLLLFSILRQFSTQVRGVVIHNIRRF